MNNNQKIPDTPRAILVDVIDPEVSKDQARKRLDELESLVKTFGGVVVVKKIQKRGIPAYSTFIGKGKVQEIADIAKEKECSLIIVNNLLKSRQIFALKEEFRKLRGEKRAGISEGSVDVWDRVDLILKIFSKHASSTEAKLQIELASIRHMGPRIFGMGIELSKQAGAMGLRAGGGESNIEMMKRHLRKQELDIKKKLEHYDTIHEGHRRRRRRQNFKTVALVGYTNAGKTSLLNALTKKGAYVADELFATLDTRIGKLYIQEEQKEDGKYHPGQEFLISDTIGFIQDLPPSLIQAFKSTLAETIEADLLLHVIDISDSEIEEKIEVVEDILDQLELQDKPKIYVFNKMDQIKHVQPHDRAEHQEKAESRPSLMKAGKETSKALGWTTEEDLAHEQSEKLQRDPGFLKQKYKKFTPVFVSALKKEKLERLISGICKKLN